MSGWVVIDNRNGEILFDSSDEQECKEFLDDLQEESITQFKNSTIHKGNSVRRSIIRGSWIIKRGREDFEKADDKKETEEMV